MKCQICMKQDFSSNFCAASNFTGQYVNLKSSHFQPILIELHFDLIVKCNSPSVFHTTVHLVVIDYILAPVNHSTFVLFFFKKNLIIRYKRLNTISLHRYRCILICISMFPRDSCSTLVDYSLCPSRPTSRCHNNL